MRGKWWELLGHDDVDYLWNADRSGKRGVVRGWFFLLFVSAVWCFGVWYLLFVSSPGAGLVMFFNV